MSWQDKFRFSQNIIKYTNQRLLTVTTGKHWYLGNSLLQYYLRGLYNTFCTISLNDNLHQIMKFSEIPETMLNIKKTLAQNSHHLMKQNPPCRELWFHCYDQMITNHTFLLIQMWARLTSVWPLWTLPDRMQPASPQLNSIKKLFHRLSE